MRAIWLIGTVVPVLALALVVAVPVPVKLVYNGSESAPVGLYWIDHRSINRHDLVLVRVPLLARDLVERRRYLPPKVPLIKRVAGIAGDTICRCGNEILIDGLTVAVIRQKDQIGRALPVWQGCHVLTAEDVFLLQEHQLSFDGRYFGPVDRSLIIGRAVKLRFPWWKWKKS